MTTVFTDLEWEHLWQSKPQTALAKLVLDDFETLDVVPSCLGRGYIRNLELCPGLSLELLDQTFHQTWQLRLPVHEHLVQYHIYVSGYVTHADVHPTLDRHRSYFSGSGTRLP